MAQQQETHSHQTRLHRAVVGNGPSITPTKDSPTSTDGSNNATTTTNQLLREGVDYSEGGWATDTAASLVGLLYLITALTTAPYQKDLTTTTTHHHHHDEFLHFAALFGGTFIAHLFGGLAHRYFPNRASDGTGQIGFYLCMIIGYSGNCLRYGWGWSSNNNIWWLIDPHKNNDVDVTADDDDNNNEPDLIALPSSWSDAASSIVAWIALANMIYLILTGLHVICQMSRTNQVTDDAADEGLSFHPDILFGIGESFTAIMENVVPLIYLWSHRDRLNDDGGLFLIAAIIVNLVGWAAVYMSAFLYLTVKLEYNPNLMQRIFHYCMIAMVWSIDMFVRTTILEEEE